MTLQWPGIILTLESSDSMGSSSPPSSSSSSCTTEMIELDGDEERISSQGRYAERDIVQVRPRLSKCPLSRMLGLVINEGTMMPADPALGLLFFPFIWFLPFSHFILIPFSLPIFCQNVPPCLLSYYRLSYHTIHPHSLLFFIPFRFSSILSILFQLLDTSLCAVSQKLPDTWE